MSKSTTSIKALFNVLTVFLQTELIRQATDVNVSDGLRVLMTANEKFSGLTHKMMLKHYYNGRDHIRTLNLNIVNHEVYHPISEKKIEELSKFSKEEINNMATAMKNKARKQQLSA